MASEIRLPYRRKNSSPDTPAMRQRDQQIQQLQAKTFDCLIVGGGINGAVAAAALAAKGASVALIDKGDFAGETSSQSSNLAWGGIKYLESREFLLVNKLCKSRNLLMDSYPSTVKEIRFLTAIQKGFRFPPFFIYLGSLLYWVLGRFRTAAPKYLSAKAIRARESAINTDHLAGGLEYSDCYLYDNDSRFVFNFVRSALKSGATASNYIESISATFENDIWTHTLRDNLGHTTFQVQAKTLINACGPWADQFNQTINNSSQFRHLFSKGVHLTVPKVTEEERVLAFFASDGRLFFVIPMGPTTCIGTTDTQVASPETRVTKDDRQFLLDNANRCLRLENPLTEQDIIAERCGVRPLAVTHETDCEDWVALSRKHEIDCSDAQKVVTIYGGKITDCINVGESLAKAISDLGISLEDNAVAWYGEPNLEHKNQFLKRAKEIGLDDYTSQSSSEPLSKRLWRRYGMDAMPMLDAIDQDSSQADLLIDNAEYLRCEIQQAADCEMVATLDDFLRRRSKIAMVVSRKDIEQSNGLREACDLLFGEASAQKMADYRALFDETNSATDAETKPDTDSDIGPEPLPIGA